jgi:hypothetical protein
VKKESGKKKAKRVAFEGIPAFCDGAPARISGSLRGTDTLRRKKFRLESSDALQTLSFRGAVKNRGRKAVGTLSFSGAFEVEGATLSCATGPRGWSASRV